MGPGANYKCGAVDIYLGNLSVQILYCEFCWYVGFEGLPWKILRIRLSEIEQFQQYVTAFKVHYLQYPFYCQKFWGLDPLRLNFRAIWASMSLIATYLSDCWKILRIRSLRLNLGTISAVITVFVIQELSDCRKFLKIRPLRLNVRTISAACPSITIHWLLYYGDCSIRVFRSLLIM